MMLCHDVFFTLKDKTKADDLVSACDKYLTVQSGIVHYHCGKRDPDLNRNVNDQTYDVGLHLVFESRAAHDAYQDDPTHNIFIAECKPNWEQVRVFDSLVAKR
jgi:hypothetical protein